MNKTTHSLTLLLAAASLWSCTEGQTRNLEPLTPVKTEAVEGQTLSTSLRYSATIRPSAQMELAFRNGGFVDSILKVSGHTIDQGDSVEQGTVLAHLRPADFEHRLEQVNSQITEARFALDAARARADDAQVRVGKTEQDFARAVKLFEAESLTRTSYDAAKADYDSARAKLESAKADIESAQSRILTSEAAAADARLALQDAALVAPMSGTIVERTIELGGLAGAGRKAFVLADTRSVKAVFGIPDTEIRSVKLGMALNITSEALPAKTFSGRITSISPAADERSRIFEAEMTVVNTGGLLKSGMIASVNIGASPAETAAAVPLSAIVRSPDPPDSYAVYAIDFDGGRAIARRRNVLLGEPLGNRIVVKSGLAVGETVISSGSTLVRDGAAVQIVP